MNNVVYGNSTTKINMAAWSELQTVPSTKICPFWQSALKTEIKLLQTWSFFVFGDIGLPLESSIRKAFDEKSQSFFHPELSAANAEGFARGCTVLSLWTLRWALGIPIVFSFKYEHVYAKSASWILLERAM